MKIEIKSRREIAKMRQAGLVVWEAHQRVAELIRPGVTTAELDAAVEKVFDSYQATPLFKGVAGKTPFPSVTCTSVNEAVVHGIPDDQPLRQGDIVSVDTGCRLGGWCGDAAVTHAIGQPEPQVARLLEVTAATLQLAIDLLPQREMWSEVAAELEKHVKAAGFSVIEQFVGHGIGREMHEPPQVPNFVSEHLLAKEDFPLRPGLVLAVEPMVSMGNPAVRCLADHWTQVTSDGSYSAHFEHTLAITSGGVEILTGPP